MEDRYKVHSCFWYHYITAGTGTRRIGKFISLRSAQRMASELSTAYMDGWWYAGRYK